MNDHTHAPSQVVEKPSYSEVPLLSTYERTLERSPMPANTPAVESDSPTSVLPPCVNTVSIDPARLIKYNTVFQSGPTPPHSLGQEAIHVWTRRMCQDILS